MTPGGGGPGGAGVAAIEFAGVGKRFDDIWILHDIDLRVPHGEILGLIGPSGCGKTTMVRLATGVHRPDAGDVRLLGADPAELARSRRRELGYLMQRPVLFEHLSLWENLNFHASLNGVRFRRRHRLEELLDLVDLADDRSKLVAESSGGMQRRLALAAAMVHAPRVLMLDEPTAGIDPILRRRFWEHFRSMGRAGTTLIVTTQFVEEASHCDTVGMLAGGRLAARGSPGELQQSAFGGQRVDVEFDRPVDRPVAHRLGALAGVADSTVQGERVVRLSVDTATLPFAALADAVTAAATAEAAEPAPRIVAVTEVATDWNDVFIELVGAHA